jgi:uncharacterized ParB-like nuclease family protein
MSIVGRIGKWTSKAALEEALQQVGDEDPVMVVSISRTDNQMRYWTANCNNMEANWMADNIKDDVMGGRL